MKLNITPILTEKDFEYFVQLFEFNISSLYPFSSNLTARATVDTHKLGEDPNGYFTKRKTIWKLMNEHDIILGFSVATEKRGGSVKFGPTIVVKDYRNQGIGSEFRLLLEKHYSDKGYRKSYLTTISNNTAVLSYLINIGYKIELHLKKHYTLKDDEIILGKFICENIDKVAIPKLSKQVNDEFGEYVIEYLQKYYDEIDNVFFKNLSKALSENFEKIEESFIQKKKVKFESKEDKFFAITSPKRGGCVKISPLVLSGDEKIDSCNLEKIIKFYDEKYHKFYTFVPIDRYRDCKILKKNGFVLEGVFREPYKMGCDMFIFSYFKKSKL